MAKKPQEDNRDIFDKVLDAAPVVGAVIGGRLGYKALKRARPRPEAGLTFGSRFDVPAGTMLSGIGGYMAGDLVRMHGQEHKKNKAQRSRARK